MMLQRLSSIALLSAFALAGCATGRCHVEVRTIAIPTGDEKNPYRFEQQSVLICDGENLKVPDKTVEPST